MSKRKALGLAGILLCVGLLFSATSAQAVGVLDDECDAEFDAFEVAIFDLMWCAEVTPETGCIEEQLAWFDAYDDVTDCWFDD